MNRLCGSRQVVHAIWQVGLPVSLATEQRHSLTLPTLDRVADITHDVLNWLDVLAEGIRLHKESGEYKELRRKSGTKKGESGLTATEHAAKQAIRRARKDLRDARTLNAKWGTRDITYETASAGQWGLLQSLWNGSLEETLNNAIAQKQFSPTPKMAVVAPVQRHERL